MTTNDPKSGAKPTDPADPLSATGIFLNAFRTQPDPEEEPAQENLAPPAAANPAPSPGEFTQMFAALQTPAPPPVARPLPSAPPPQPPPQQPAEEATRIFVRQATPIPEQPPKAAVSPAPAAPAQRLKGFSAPGASDFASDDGSFSQFFRKVPAPQPPPPPVPPPVASSLPPAVNLPAKSLGATDLFGARSAAELRADRNAGQASTDAGSVTSWMRKLSEEVEPESSTQIFEAQPSAPAAPAGPGEFTRIMSGEAMRAAREVPTTPAPAMPSAAMGAPVMPAAAVPKVQPPAAMEPPRVAAPKLAAPAVSAPPSKLQQMLPILLVLNGFLLLVLIVLVVFVLLRK